MPHYADGTPAKIGDKVKGKPYNTPDEVIGEIVSITPNSETCNCIVAFTHVFDLEGKLEKAWPDSDILLQTVLGSDGRRRGIIVKTDYGETGAFTKIL